MAASYWRCWLPSPAVPSRAGPARRIIDVHLHACAYNHYGPTPHPNPVTGRAPTCRSDAVVGFG